MRRLLVILTLLCFVVPAFGQAKVKGYTRTTKSGKTVHVKAYTRKAPTKKVAVKGYTRTTKSGKTVTVKGYTRKAPTKKHK